MTRAIGVDRHGALVVQAVSMQASNAAADVCFIGTRSSFGAFHKETVLIDSSGTSRSLASIVEADTLGSLRFERALEVDSFSINDTACRRIWREIEDLCISIDKDEFVFRALRQDVLPKGNRSLGMTVRSSGQRHYIGIQKAPFLSALREAGLSVLLEALTKLRSNEAGAIEVERKNYPLLLWLILHLHMNRESYRLAFDSIQHSATVGIDMEQPSGAIEQARTSFIAGAARAVGVAWEERLWSPVSSGFVVVGR
ncbi:MAG: hypothetical protein AB7K64_13900 [Variibacter sp.]